MYRGQSLRKFQMRSSHRPHPEESGSVTFSALMCDSTLDGCQLGKLTQAWVFRIFAGLQGTGMIDGLTSGLISVSRSTDSL